LAFYYVNRFCMGLLYGRAGRLTAHFGGLRPGQYSMIPGEAVDHGSGGAGEAADAPRLAEVRKTPSWPRSWANFSLLELYSHRNAWANLHLLGQPNTFLAGGAGGPPALALGALLELGVFHRDAPAGPLRRGPFVIFPPTFSFIWRMSDE
jgi:hypothetical protein